MQNIDLINNKKLNNCNKHNSFNFNLDKSYNSELSWNWTPLPQLLPINSSRLQTLTTGQFPN